MMNDVIEQSSQLGKAAFERGAKRVPAQDPDFCKALYGQNGNTLPMLKAWISAWDKANLAAPVEVVEVEDPIFGKSISSYTRAQALADGELVCANSGAIDEVTRQHFKVPVAMSRRLCEIIQKAVDNERHCNDWKGVWHDVCWMSRTKLARELNASTRVFRVIITGAGRNRYWDLKAVCGPDDNGEPCITFLLRNED